MIREPEGVVPVLKANVTPGRRNARKYSLWRTLCGQWQLMAMSVPMLLYILLFHYGPMWGWITVLMDDKPNLPLREN